jgi:hypothetical protein
MNGFKARWEALSPIGHSGGRYRVYPDHPLNFFLDYSLAGRREVIIDAHENGINAFELPPFENIEIVQTPMSDGLRIGLILHDDDLVNSFSVMCYDLAMRSRSALGPAAALDIVMSGLRNWSDLLRRRTAGGLTYQEALGLIGELLVLEALLEERAANLHTVIRGWRGPNGDARDIGLNGTRIEVKTRHSTVPVALKISSLSQLDDCGDRVYVVLNRVSPAEHGISLATLATRVSGLLILDPQAIAEFDRKLELAGFDSEAAVARHVFSLDERRVYAVREAFPRLIPSNVPQGIVSASYEISGPFLDEYRITWECLMEGFDERIADSL